MNDKELVNQIIEVLPQLQCKKCEHPDCKSYAQSIINMKEKTDKCEPGGPQTQNHIKALLLNHNYQPNEQMKVHEIANIVREECIGCTICIKVCPVDAIVGARHMIHKVLEHQCNGCELCIDECPVNCMSMITADQKNWVWPSKQSEDSKNNYYQRLDRLDHIKKDKEENRKKVLEDSEMQEYIKYALEVESKKNKNIKKYE
jgi:electron transport complex protein RnfB